MLGSKRKVEFGDFQTPPSLAARLCAYLAGSGVRPASLVEPTCGTGTILLAGLRQFPAAQVALGLDVNEGYLSQLRQRLAAEPQACRVELHQCDFFDFDWEAALRALPAPVLVIGNPPWVTSARVGSLGGSNLPAKSNFMGLAGIDAKTGKSNFDVSEWMALRLLYAMRGARGHVALLLKTSVTRRVLSYAWAQHLPVGTARLLPFNAAEAFGASTSAGVLVFETVASTNDPTCRVCDMHDWHIHRHDFGRRGDVLVSDMATYDRTAHLAAVDCRQPRLRWRSGIKHDCAGVFELREKQGRLWNGLGEAVEVEADRVYPLLKGSAVANGAGAQRGTNRRFLITTQRSPREDTRALATAAPRLWAYLSRHARVLGARRSSIYRNRPPFAVFGVGAYTFRPWKVAICGLYKRFRFAVIGPQHDRPVLFDDTSYFLSFDREDDARLVADLLNSGAAQAFFGARVFWDSKRPVTAALLQQLDLGQLARELGQAEAWDRMDARSSLFETVSR